MKKLPIFWTKIFCRKRKIWVIHSLWCCILIPSLSYVFFCRLPYRYSVAYLPYLLMFCEMDILGHKFNKRLESSVLCYSQSLLLEKKACILKILHILVCSMFLYGPYPSPCRNICSYTTSFCTVTFFINTFFAVKCANNTRGPSTGEGRDWQPWPRSGISADEKQLSFIVYKRRNWPWTIIDE